MIDNLTREAICNRAMQGHGAAAIARDLQIPKRDVERTIKQEFIVPPSRIGPTMRQPLNYTPPIPTDTVALIEQRHGEGVDWTAIAHEAGVSRGTVASTIHKSGLPITRQKREWTVPEYEFLLDNMHTPYKVLADTLDRSVQQIKWRYTILRKMGVDVPDRRYTHV